MALPIILSLQAEIEKELNLITESSIEKELRDEIDLLQEEKASGFPDEDDFLGILMNFQQHPEEIKKHITAAANDSVTYNENFFPEFFTRIRAQLTESLVEKANVVIIRYNEAEIIHLDFHRIDPEESIITEIPYGFRFNGEELSLYEVGKMSIVSVDLYGHPIDVSEVFMSISNEYFSGVIGLRKGRILQSIYRKTRDFLLQNYSMKNAQFFIGDYSDPPWTA